MRSETNGKTRGESRLRSLAACGLALALLLCLASPLPAVSAATAFSPQPQSHAVLGAAFLAAYVPTRTACYFNSGPLAGTIGEYDAPEDEKVGAPCEDGRGSRGTVVGEKPPERAGGKPRPIDRHNLPQPDSAQSPRPTPVVPTPVQKSPSQQQQNQPQAIQQPTGQQQQGQQQQGQPQPIGNGAHPDASAAYANLTDAQIQQEFDQIVQQASNGAIRYNVPPAMTVGQPVTVQVEVSGANASQSPGNFQATGSGNLKVTPLMEVDLSAPGSPGMFTIVPDPVQSGQQMVPDNGKTDWVWTVTPLQGGQQPGSLQIDAYMVLNAKLPDGQAVTRQITSYTVQVPIKTQSALQAVLSFLGKNWSTLLGYILPSGAGVMFILWYLARNKPKRKAKVHSA
jgi:hypothetical protein